MQENQQEPKPKHQDKIVALDSLSLGISIVAAIIIGFGIGYGLKQLTGYSCTLSEILARTLTEMILLLVQ